MNNTLERSDPPTRLVSRANQRVERLIARRLVQPVFIRSMKEGKQDSSVADAGFKLSYLQTKLWSEGDPPTRLVGRANQRVERLIARHLVQPVFIRSINEGKQDSS